MYIIFVEGPVNGGIQIWGSHVHFLSASDGLFVTDIYLIF